MKIITIIALLAIFIILIIEIFYNKECFTQSLPYLIYDIQINPNILNIVYDNWNYEPSIDSLKNYKNIMINSKYPFHFNIMINDVYHCITMKQKILTVLPDKKVGIFLRAKSSIKDLSIQEIKSIGYFNDLDILSFILKVCEVSPKLIKLNYTSINNSIFNDIDCVFIFTTVSNIIIDDKIDVVTYDFDIHKMKVLLPYCTIENIDLSIYYPLVYQTDFPVKSYLALDMVLCGEEYSVLNKEYDRLLDKYNNYDSINYYTIYANIFDITLQKLPYFNEHIIVRTRLPILEQFKSHLVPLNNVPGFFNSDLQILQINSNIIEGNPLDIGDEIILKNQKREEENGIYMYDSPNKLIRKTIVIQEDNHFDPRYECYNHPEIAYPGLCESNFDEIGQNPKPIYIWDRRCERNEECPYYQKNKTYNNYRGGCLDGYCEMPVGMSNISYRKGTGNPYCYNCINPADPNCCDTQHTPDYAFELDQFERNYYSQNI